MVESPVKEVEAPIALPLTEEQITQLEEALRQGLSYKNALARVEDAYSFPYQRFRAWMTRGGYPMGAGPNHVPEDFRPGPVGDPLDVLGISDVPVAPRRAYEPPEPYGSFAKRMHSAWVQGQVNKVTTGGTQREGSVRGRPPRDLSADEQFEIIECLRKGQTWIQAAKVAQVQPTTLLAWMRLGGHPDVAPLRTPVPRDRALEPYKSFVDKSMEAERESRGVQDGS